MRMTKPEVVSPMARGGQGNVVQRVWPAQPSCR
jgi:hypothetical protein